MTVRPKTQPMIGSVEPPKNICRWYNIVLRARRCVSFLRAASRGGGLRCLIDELPPARAVLRELGPLLEVSRYACPREFMFSECPDVNCANLVG